MNYRGFRSQRADWMAFPRSGREEGRERRMKGRRISSRAQQGSAPRDVSKESIQRRDLGLQQRPLGSSQ